MRKIITIVILLALYSAYSAEVFYGDAVIERILRVYDGDTYYVNLKDFPPIIGTNVGIRLRGVDCPEIRKECSKILAIEVRDYVIAKFKNAKKIELKRMSRDKYFRIDADIYVDGSDLAKELIKLGYAKSYDGGTKTSWKCSN